MKRIAIALLCSLTIIGAQAESYGDVVITQVTSIYDGDTFRADIEGWPAVVGKRVPIRINGIDTPEMRGECEREVKLARVAKQFTVEYLRSAKVIELRNIERGKYFRLVADVFADGINIGESLVNKGLAYRYDGGRKQSWCQ